MKYVNERRNLWGETQSIYIALVNMCLPQEFGRGRRASHTDVVNEHLTVVGTVRQHRRVLRYG